MANPESFDGSKKDAEFRSYVKSETREGKSAQEVYIGGGSTSGLEGGGKITIMAIDDSDWYAVPVSALGERKNIAIQNQSNNGAIVLFNYDNTAPSSEGWKIEDGGFKAVMLGAGSTVYCRILSGSGTVCVDEVA